jgi:hypothetical protein
MQDSDMADMDHKENCREEDANDDDDDNDNDEFDMEAPRIRQQISGDDWDIYQDEDRGIQRAAHEGAWWLVGSERERGDEHMLTFPGIATLQQQPHQHQHRQPPLPSRGIRFASIVATNVGDGPLSSSSKPQEDLLDLMECSRLHDHRSPLLTLPDGDIHRCQQDSFDIFEQNEPETTTTTSTPYALNRSIIQQSLEGACECCCEEDPMDDDDNASQMSEESDPQDTRRGRQMLYSAGGTGALALLGWVTYKLFHILDKTNDLEDDTAMVGVQHLSGNVNATDPTTILAEAKRAVIVNTDVLSQSLSRISIHSGGSVSGGSVSAGSASGGSASAGSAAGGGSILFGGAGTEQILLVNPALKA